MKIHHIGYAVSKMEEAVKAFISLGFEVGQPISDDKRNVLITFAQNDNIHIELVSSINKNSPVDSIIKKNGGEGTPYQI